MPSRRAPGTRAGVSNPYTEVYGSRSGGAGRAMQGASTVKVAPARGAACPEPDVGICCGTAEEPSASPSPAECWEQNWDSTVATATTDLFCCCPQPQTAPKPPHTPSQATDQEGWAAKCLNPQGDTRTGEEIQPPSSAAPVLHLHPREVTEPRLLLSVLGEMLTRYGQAPGSQTHPNLTAQAV